MSKGTYIKIRVICGEQLMKLHFSVMGIGAYRIRHINNQLNITNIYSEA